MKLKRKQGRENLEDDLEIIKGVTIDIDDNGKRWEGDALNGKAFGYGCFYNENNQMIYSGFVYEGKYICYGEEFYCDTNTIEYRGNYMNGLRHGYGCCYDKEGNLVYEGYWSSGSNNTVDLCIERVSNATIHNLVRNLTIGDMYYSHLKKLKIINYYNLKNINIHSYCFDEVELFEISNCNKLKCLKIGFGSFVKMVFFAVFKRDICQLRIHDCSKLKKIDIGDFSFGDFGGKFELFSK